MNSLNRRAFGIGSAALMSSMALGGSGRVWEEDRSLTEKRLVLLGINALARAPELSYFAGGHRGAAMISAHIMCVDNKFDDAAVNRIVQLFDLNWASSKLCSPFPEADSVQDANRRVGLALAEGGGVLREVGHDAIFAMHAIKAFRMLPETDWRDRQRCWIDIQTQLLTEPNVYGPPLAFRTESKLHR